MQLNRLQVHKTRALMIRVGKDLVLHHGAQRVFDHSKPGYMDEGVFIP